MTWRNNDSVDATTYLIPLFWTKVIRFFLIKSIPMLDAIIVIIFKWIYFANNEHTHSVCCVLVIYVEGSIPNEWFCKYQIKPNIQWCEINTNSKPQAYEDECFVTENANRERERENIPGDWNDVQSLLFHYYVKINENRINAREYVTAQTLPFNSKVYAIIFVFLHERKKIACFCVAAVSSTSSKRTKTMHT